MARRLQRSKNEPGTQTGSKRKANCVKAPRRLLLLEDYPDDAELLRRSLAIEWPDCEIVLLSTEGGFRAALQQKGCDLILSDYSLPGFDGLAALAVARQECPEVPFLFVSGAIGDEIAVESLKAGATDYVLKDRLARLVPAIRRALKEAEERARRREAEEQLEQSNKDLLRTNQEIQNFYHTLSHELKTPLTSVALDSCNQLRVCINDLLDAARLETGKLALDLKPSSLAALIKRVVTTMGQAAADKRIELMQEIEPCLPEASLDQNRMTQIITNLLSNAIRHTPEGGKIVIQAGLAAACPDCIQVSVSDTGCGIAKEDQGRVFDRLYQIKAGDAASDQGLGLGLYLCRELVQLHGGKIWVESQVGQGSTFSFLLPLSQPSIEFAAETVRQVEPAPEPARWQRRPFDFRRLAVTNQQSPIIRHPSFP